MVLPPVPGMFRTRHTAVAGAESVTSLILLAGIPELRDGLAEALDFVNARYPGRHRWEPSVRPFPHVPPRRAAQSN